MPVAPFHLSMTTQKCLQILSNVPWGTISYPCALTLSSTGPLVYTASSEKAPSWGWASVGIQCNSPTWNLVNMPRGSPNSNMENKQGLPHSQVTAPDKLLPLYTLWTTHKSNLMKTPWVSSDTVLSILSVKQQGLKGSWSVVCPPTKRLVNLPYYPSLLPISLSTEHGFARPTCL